MRTVEIIGYKRANLGKSYSKQLRAEGNAPCVLYGGKEQLHFHAPMYLFKDLVYTPNVAFVKLNIEGEEYNAILQDIQYHPVSEVILHADFLQLFDDKQIKMDIPIKFQGTAPGIIKGGRLMQKLRKISVKALPANMPESITVDVSGLDLGKSVKIGSLQKGDYEVLNGDLVTIATVAIPRALRGGGAGEEEEEDLEAAEEGASESQEGEGSSEE